MSKLLNKSSNTEVDEIPSSLLNAVNQYQYRATEYVSKMTKNINEMSAIDVIDAIKNNDYKYKLFEEAVFVGHIVTDLDSVSTAIGAAEFYGGTPAISEIEKTLNTEIKWALQYWGYKTPKYIGDIKDLSKIVLVDHNQLSQTNKCINPNNIIGIIDHHAPNIVSNNILTIDIQLIGSASTIIAMRFIRNDRKLKKSVAGMLLSAILSDTINLKSPTTTNADKLVVAVLSKIVDIDDIDKLAQEQFQAKSRMIEKLSDTDLIKGDMKSYIINDKKVAWSTIESIEKGVDKVISKKDQMIKELTAIKKEEGMDYLFLSVVDIENKKSKLLICTDLEKEIALCAFNFKLNGNIMELGSLISRKKQFIPLVKQVLTNPKFNHTISANNYNKIKMSKSYGNLIINSKQDGSGNLIRSPRKNN